MESYDCGHVVLCLITSVGKESVEDRLCIRLHLRLDTPTIVSSPNCIANSSVHKLVNPGVSYL